MSDFLRGNPGEIAQIDARTGKRRTAEVPYSTFWLAWSEYGDLWASHGSAPYVTRLRAATSQARTIETALNDAGPLGIAGDTLWVGDGGGKPRVARMQAVGAPRSRVITLGRPGGPRRDVGALAAGEGAAWAIVPDAQQLWRIDAETNATTRVDIPYVPVGVAVGRDAVWVTVGGEGP